MILSFQQTFISYELAAALVKAALDYAKKAELTISVAIVDPVGDLVAFARMDTSCVIGVKLSQTKAYTAARSGLSTTEFAAYLNKNQVPLESLHQENLALIQGGHPIIYNNQVVGGIGVCGDTGQNDDLCAQAALSILTEIS